MSSRKLAYDLLKELEGDRWVGNPAYWLGRTRTALEGVLRETAEAVREAGTPRVGQPVDEFQVKIWYRSGSAEVISHINFLAAGAIYAEAMGNERVLTAEVHCPGGCLAATFSRPLDAAGENG